MCHKRVEQFQNRVFMSIISFKNKIKTHNKYNISINNIKITILLQFYVYLTFFTRYIEAFIELSIL